MERSRATAFTGNKQKWRGYCKIAPMKKWDRLPREGLSISFFVVICHQFPCNVRKLLADTLSADAVGGGKHFRNRLRYMIKTLSVFWLNHIWKWEILQLSSIVRTVWRSKSKTQHPFNQNRCCVFRRDIQIFIQCTALEHRRTPYHHLRRRLRRWSKFPGQCCPS